MYIYGLNNKICEIPDLLSGKIIYNEAEASDCGVISVECLEVSRFEDYIISLKNCGFGQKESHSLGENQFYVLIQNNVTLYVSYYSRI